MSMQDTGDQADGLRHLQSARARVLAVASGKGGVGKTNVAVNLAVALAQRGRRPMLLDADLGLGNVDVLLGLSSRYHLAHVLAGEKSMEEIIVTGPAGIQILPAASGIASMASLDIRQQAGIMDAIGALESRLDYLIVDLAAGIGSEVLQFSRAADHVLVVLTNEPASITDAYAFMKVMSRDYGLRDFHVLPNMVRDLAEGNKLFERLASVAERYLHIRVHLAGRIPLDHFLRSAVRAQEPVLLRYPQSPAAKAFADLAEQVLAWPRPTEHLGGHQFFVSRLLESDASGR